MPKRGHPKLCSHCGSQGINRDVMEPCDDCYTNDCDPGQCPNGLQTRVATDVTGSVCDRCRDEAERAEREAYERQAEKTRREDEARAEMARRYRDEQDRRRH